MSLGNTTEKPRKPKYHPKRKKTKQNKNKPTTNCNQIKAHIQKLTFIICWSTTSEHEDCPGMAGHSANSSVVNLCSVCRGTSLLQGRETENEMQTKQEKNTQTSFYEGYKCLFFVIFSTVCSTPVSICSVLLPCCFPSAFPLSSFYIFPSHYFLITFFYIHFLVFSF